MRILVKNQTALSQNGELLSSAYSNENGNIELDLNNLELIPGEYDLVITSFNTYPYESTINVVAPEGAYLIYEDFEVISGNIEYGHLSTLSLSIENVGIDNIDKLLIYFYFIVMHHFPIRKIFIWNSKRYK